MPRILLVDDHIAVRRGLEGILRESVPGSEFGFAESAPEALLRAEEASWDLAILDVTLPGGGSPALIAQLKDRQPRLPILIYTMHSEEQFGVRAIRAGADGFLTKDSPAEDVATAARQLLAGRRFLSATLAERLANAIARGGALTSQERLSDREYQVICLLASGKGISVIAEELSLSPKTVSTYRARILEKLELDSTGALIRYALEHGIS